jgi:hypothetical protein
MGHKDVESLRRYLTPLRCEERAGKVAKAFEAFPILPALEGKPTTATIQ